MYTMKTTIIIINQKLLMFVGCRFHKEEKVVIYFETTHKILAIHAFLISVLTSNIKKSSNEYHFLGDVHHKNYIILQ